MQNENVSGAMTPSQDVRKERFEIILTFNDYIVCQRYFKINGLKNNIFKSIKFVNTLNNCVGLIENDLKLKSNLYNIYTAPHVFSAKDEFKCWINGTFNKLDVPSFVLLRDTQETYVWNGEKLELYNKRFNSGDYMDVDDGTDEMDNIIKFSFIDDGRVVYSKMIDGNNYPRFIRSNIDLSNSKNRYDSNLKPYEHYLVKLLTKNREDLIPVIINEICDVCSTESKNKNNNNNNE